MTFKLPNCYRVILEDILTVLAHFKKMSSSRSSNNSYGMEALWGHYEPEEKLKREKYLFLLNN